jgi:hypothetical protein
MTQIFWGPLEMGGGKHLLIHDGQFLGTPHPKFLQCHDLVPAKGRYCRNKSETPNSELFKCKHTRNLHQQHIFESTPLLHKPQERIQNRDENLNSLLRASPAVLSI